MIREGFELLEGYEYFGYNLEYVVNDLIRRHDNGERICIEFNGVMLYSDNVTVDSAYMDVLGCSKEDFDRSMDESLENERLRDLIEFYIEDAKGLIIDDKLDYWAKIVPIRVNDIYQGDELKFLLDIAKMQKEGMSFESINFHVNNENHSGMSFRLLCGLVCEFLTDGEELAKYLVD